MARHRRPIAVPPAPARDPLFLSIRTVGFSADVRVTDDRDVDEVIFAVASAATREKNTTPAAAAADEVVVSGPAVAHDDVGHERTRCALRDMMQTMCDETLEDVGKILVEERARRERIS